MKYILFIVSFFFISGFNQTNKKGLEIYQVKIPDTNVDSVENPGCHCCFEPKKEDLYDLPLFDESDIIFFDWGNQKIYLNRKGLKKLIPLEIPGNGLPVAFVLDGEPIYGFWLWNVVSSIGCDRVWTWPASDFKLRFGLPQADNFTYGEDPRFDPRLRDYVFNKYIYHRDTSIVK